MLADLGGKHVADGNVAEKVKTQKKIIRDFLSGDNGRRQVEAGLPNWMKFPVESYTERGGFAPPINGPGSSRCSSANRCQPGRRLFRVPPPLLPAAGILSMRKTGIRTALACASLLCSAQNPTRG
ncbi:hypothetical protein [Mesorhizobium japonicum]|uniref:hypothetical protein n=2 Tax=Mesorhizobium TaxID=68287 RepID=UPI001FF01640|nr:hypothetical protein [Mesorhizobium japonicum]